MAGCRSLYGERTGGAARVTGVIFGSDFVSVRLIRLQACIAIGGALRGEGTACAPQTTLDGICDLGLAVGIS
jgi:hypothetical protein